MEQFLETIELKSDESNELLFRVKIEGASQLGAKTRLVCETSDVSYSFNGRKDVSGEDMIQFMIPSMNGKIEEGTYPARVEVVVENRYFEPVKFNIKFKKPVTVVAEVVTKKLEESVQKPKELSVSVESVKVVQRQPEKKVVQPQPEKKMSTLKERYAIKK